MKQEEALELFSWHAFHNPCPGSKFSKLTETVVEYCGGLPLPLEVLGSHLFKGDRSLWKTTIMKLKDIPHHKIHEILKISYDALDEHQRKIFLHISCFFVEMDQKYVTHILHGCGLHPEGEISVLLQRCLVTVNELDQLMMHDLLRDMGREVVRAESPEEPGERSRLWRQKNVIDVLNEESLGTIKIEGLALNKLQRPDKKRFGTEAFRNMKRLKLLQLNYVQLDGDYNYLSKQLRWLCWHGFSLSTIGNEFLDEQNLVSIDLQYSKLKQVWEQPKFLGKLKILNLSHSHDLTHTPDFSNLPKLKYLILEDCKVLSEVHESIGDLGKLVTGWIANGEGGGFVIDCLSLNDLSTLKRMCFNYCTSLPLTRDLATTSTDLERDHYDNSVELVPNFSDASRQSILQVLTAREDGGICLAGNEFPKPFIYVRKNDQVFFQVPHIIGCNLEALTVRVACSYSFREGMLPGGNSICVTNHSKRICGVVRPAYPTEITSHEVIWQGILSNNQLMLEGGDFVLVEFVTGSGFRVKKTGAQSSMELQFYH